MYSLTTKEVRGMMEAYSNVYVPMEEEREIEELGLQMIENAAYVLFSQGYSVDDLVDYFAEAETNVIVEDFVSFAEGQTYLSESFIVSDEYIEEQFQQLDERLGGLLRGAQGLLGRGITAVKNFAAGAQKTAKAQERLKNIQNIRNAKNTVPPGSAKVTVSGQPTGPRIPGTGPKITTSGGKPATPNMLQKAGNWAKTQLGKLPGAQTAQKFAKSGAGKFLGKMGSRVLPGLGVATYGMDAAQRFKKGDWGGGLLSTAGAVTSAIPGAGLVAGLAPAAIQAATDAAGLTGDKSRKGAPPKGPKPPKAPTPPKPPSPAAPAAPAAPSGGGGKPPAPPKPAGSEKPKPEGSKLTPMQQWAKANPKLADKVKLGQSGYEEISAMRTKPGPNEKQDQTPTTGPKTTPEQDKDFAQQAMKDVQAQQERERKKLEQQKKSQQSSQPQLATSSTTKESYEMLADYFMITGQADSIAEAYYIIAQLDEETMVGILSEAKHGTKVGRKKLAKKIRKGEKIGKSGPGTGFAAVEKAAKEGGARDPEAVAAAAMWKTYGGKKG